MKEDQGNREFNKRRFFKAAGMICVGLVTGVLPVSLHEIQ